MADARTSRPSRFPAGICRGPQSTTQSAYRGWQPSLFAVIPSRHNGALTKHEAAADPNPFCLGDTGNSEENEEDLKCSGIITSLGIQRHYAPTVKDESVSRKHVPHPTRKARDGAVVPLNWRRVNGTSICQPIYLGKISTLPRPTISDEQQLKSGFRVQMQATIPQLGSRKEGNHEGFPTASDHPLSLGILVFFRFRPPPSCTLIALRAPTGRCSSQSPSFQQLFCGCDAPVKGIYRAYQYLTSTTNHASLVTGDSRLGYLDPAALSRWYASEQDLLP